MLLADVRHATAFAWLDLETLDRRAADVRALCDLATPPQLVALLDFDPPRVQPPVSDALVLPPLPHRAPSTVVHVHVHLTDPEPTR